MQWPAVVISRSSDSSGSLNGHAWLKLRQVYKALSHGVQPVAVKVFPLTANAEQHAEFQREVVLLKSCRDGNIVQVPHHVARYDNL